MNHDNSAANPLGAGGISGTSEGVPGDSPERRTKEIYARAIADLLRYGKCGNPKTAANSSGAGESSGASKEVPGDSPDAGRDIYGDITKDPSGRNVKILFPVRNGALYKPAEILDGLRTIVPTEKILGMGVLSAITEWNVLLADTASSSALVRKRKIPLQDGTTGIATFVGVREAIIRVQWLPMMVEDGRIRDLLEPFGTVEEIEWELYAEQELKGIRNGVRRVRLNLREKVEIEDLPHRTKVEGYDVLCTVFGRKPRCLRCNAAGHFFRDCPQRKKNKPTFADKVRNAKTSDGIVHAPGPSPEAMYEEVAKPLLEELEMLTVKPGSPLSPLRSSSPSGLSSPLRTKPRIDRAKEDIDFRMPVEDLMETVSPSRNKEEDDSPCIGVTRKRPLEFSPVKRRLWADDSDLESRYSALSANSTKSKKADSPVKKKAPDHRTLLEIAEDKYLKAIHKMDQDVELLGPEMKKRVKEAIEFFTRKPMTLNVAIDPGAAANGFRRKTGTYAMLRKLERLHEDYRRLKFGPDEEIDCLRT